MNGYIFAGTADELRATSTKVINLDETHQIGIFNIDNTFYAIDNLCSHKQAPLHPGDIEDLPLLLNDTERNTTISCVRCPKHKSKFCGGLYFSLGSGRALTKGPAKAFDPSWKLATYDVKIVDGNVYVGTVPMNGALPQTGKKKGKKDPWAPVTLTNIQRYNHDSFYYDFEMEVLTRDVVSKEKNKKVQKELKKKAIGAKIILSKLSEKEFECWHLDLRSIDGFVTREYTPITTWNAFKNSHKLRLLIKLYAEGLMSQKLAKAQVGDKFLIGPPKKTVATSFFENGGERVLGCIAGGTGIAPFYQMLATVEKNLLAGLQTPKISIVYSNKKEEDILLREELLYLQKQYPTHISVVHTLTREEPDGFDLSSGYLFGRVSTELIKKYLSPSTHSHAFVSGPNGMWTTIFEKLKEANYNELDCTELEA